jgi:hypothetical protein
LTPSPRVGWNHATSDMAKVFISYRRDDVAGHAGRLADHLTERLGDGSVFMDVDAIPPGEQFDRYIDENLQDASMCVVVIGKRWSATRLFARDDFVRHEVAAAFSRGIRVIPALFDGAALPPASQLPPDLASLATCQAYDFGTGRDFKRQVTQLLADVERGIAEHAAREAQRRKEASRTVALRPHQYPIGVLFVCALVVLAAVTSLAWVPTQLPIVAELRLAQDSEAKGQHIVAIAKFRSVLGVAPESRVARLGLAQALFATGSADNAAEAMKLLAGVTLSGFDWQRLSPLMPEEYRRQFQDAPK